MGFGLDSDAIHSPNEHVGIFNYLKGIETIPLFYKYFVELSEQKSSDNSVRVENSDGVCLKYNPFILH